MAKNIVGYIANLGKSVSYSAVDKVKSMTPSSAEFVETNADLFKTVYNSVRDYKITYKRGMDIFSKSKIYEAGDVLKNSLIEDIKTGKLYNKEREDTIAMKSMGLSDQDMDLNFDFDGFDDNLDFSADDITTGDKVVSSSIDSSSRRSAEMISTVTARTGEYIVESQKMNTNLLYTQHMQTHSMLHGNLSSINDNIGNLINFSDKVVKVHIDNSAEYYKRSTELMQDQTALLREIVDILRPKDEKKEEKQKDRITYDDLVGANGMPDLKMYLSNIKKNSENVSGMLSSMNNMFGEDTNMLATLVSSPLKFIPNAIVNAVVPKAIEESMENLDKSLGSIFGSMVTKFNTMAKSDNMIESTIGSLLGVRSTSKDDIDTSKYNKGKVDWDGKSKKALEEVIPSQLAKIISLLSGQGEKIYDYEKGKFISGKDIKNDYENMKKNYVKSSTSDMEDYMKDYAKLMTFNSLKEKKSFEEDLEKFFTKLYSENKLFDVNSATLDQDHLEYGIDSKNFRTIRTLYKKAPKYMQHQINASILEGRNKQTRDFKELEDGGNSIMHYLFNGSNIDEFIKENKLEKKYSSVLTNNLNATVDNYGRNIFFYLQNIYKELSFMRQYGNPIGTPPNRIQDPMKIVSSDGSEYSPAEKTIKDIAIPRNPRKPRSEQQEEINRREEERFRRSELRRRERDSDLINFSDEDNERLLGSKLSLKIDEERFNRRRELEESREPSIIDRLLAAQNLSEKTRVMIDKITELSRKPTEFVTATIDKVDQRMYEFVYGREDVHGSNDIKGFLDLTLYELRNTFSKFNNFMDEKILTPLKDKLGLGKEKFKGFLSSIGLDPAEMRKNIKTFFFGDRNTGKEGLLTSTIQAVKDNAKSLFGSVKDSVSSTTAPIRDKFRSKFRSRRQDLLDDMDRIDEEGDDYVDPSDQQNPYDLQNRINRLTGVSRANSDRSQQYYDQIDWDSDENKEYLDKHTYASGLRTINDETAELYYLHERIRELNNEARTANVTRRIAILNELTPLKQKYNELKSSVQGFHQSKRRYKDRLANRKFDNINKYYTESISRSLDMSDDESFKDVMNSMFESRRDSKDADFTVEDLMRSARKLSLDNQDGEKYESIIDKIADYTDKYYGSDINKKLSTLAEEGYYQKLYDPESYRSEGLPRTAEEYYEISSDFNGGKNIMSEIEEGNESLNNHTSLLREISDNIKSLKDLFTSLSRGGGRRNPGPGPRLDLNPDLITTPEGRATHTFAQELVTMISNWMYGRTPHFDKGGYIDQPTVATVGKGEIVLSAENVDKMTSVFNDVISGIKNKEKTKTVATGTLDKLAQESGLDMDNIRSVEEFIRNNPKVKANYDSMTKTEKKKYAKVVNFLDYKRVEKNEKQEADNETLVNQIKDELLSGTRAVSRSLFGEPKEDRKKFGEVVNDVTGNISKYAPDMLGKGIIGAGLSLVTGAIGGPLLGAAVGAGISLTKNSSKVQDFLFGEMVDGERQGGVIGKNILGGIKKYLPDMKSYGITGALAGFLTPLGAIGGLLLGSSIGFAKNNQSVMSTLFGEEGLFKEESKQKLKKAIPKIAAGALVGGMVGPFGLMGNLVLGAGVGLASSTEDFRTAILGRYDENDKKFKGGLLPTMRDTVLDPLKSFAVDIKNNGMEFIKKHMILPVANAMDPIRKELSLLAKGMFDKVGDTIQGMFKETFAPLNKWMEDKIMKPIGGTIVKFIKGTFKLGAGAATLPFKAIGGVGNHLRKKHIKNGNADYMTAEERMQYADEKGIKYNTKFDEYLNGLSDEEANSMYDILSSVKNSGKSARKLRKQNGTRIGNNIATYVDYDTTKELMYHFKNGNMDKAEQLLRENKKGLFGRKRRHDLDERQQDELLKYMRDNYDAYHNADKRQELMDKEREDLYTQLRKKGFKDISDKNIDKYLGMLDKERKSDKRKSNKIDENDPDITPSTRILLERQKERHTEIVGLMEEAIKAIRGIEENTETIEERTVKTGSSDNQVDIGDVTNADGSVIDQMRDSYKGKREPIIRIDEYGNVMEFKRTSDGELKADTSDSSTLEAIKAARADDEREQSIVDQLKEMANKGGSDEDEDGKKKKKKGGILGLLGGLGGMLKGLLNPKMLGLAGTAIMALPVLPQLLNAVMEDGISGLITQLPSLVFNGVEKGITEILPATMKSFWDYFNTHNGDDPSIIDRGAHTAIREIATGGKMSKAGLNHYEKLGKTLNAFGKTGKEGSRIGRFLSRGLKAMSPITYAKMGTKASLFTVPKMVGKGVGKVAEGVSKLYAKVDEKTGLKRIGEAAKGRMSNYITRTADAVGAKALGEAAKASDQTLVSKFVTKMSEFFSKLFSNKTVVKLVGAENAERLVKEFVPNFLKEISERLAKDAAKISGKVAGLLATGGIINIMFAIADFISGYNDAKDILGITEEPTLAMKIASGILKSVNGLFIITSLIPERIYVNLVLDNMSFLFKDLQKMRARAKQQAKEYKEKNKIKGKFSVQDYNQKMREQNKKKNSADLNGDGKVGFLEGTIDFGKQAFNTVKEWTVNSWNATKDAVKSVGSAIANGASSAWNGIKNFGKNALGWFTGKGGAGKGDETPAGGYPSRMNNFTYYSQGDPRWNSERIDGTTVKIAGCGPTSMAMIISELTGQAHRPDEFVKDALAHGQWSRNGANWTMFKYFADKYGVPYQEAGSYDKFQQMAAQGIPQAVSGQKRGVAGSPFTSGGHIITVLGTDGNGNYIVNDPVSPERSKLYPNEIIQKGWRNSWGFGNPGTYNANGAGQTTYGAQSGGQQQEQKPSGLSGLFSDLTNAATKSFDKLYGLDKIVGMSSGSTAPSSTTLPTDPSVTAGQGGKDVDVNLDVNPLAATDFEDTSIVNKIKGMMKKAPALFANKVTSLTGKDAKSFTDIKSDAKSVSDLRDKLLDESAKYESKKNNYTGMGGVDDDKTTTASAQEIEHQDLTKYTDISEQQFNQWLGTKKKSTKPFTSSDANIFLNAANKTGLDPRYIMAHAAWESGWGTSRIARDKNNYYGIGAFNKSPYSSALSFKTASDGILAGAEWIKKNYIDRGQNTLHKMIFDPSGKNHTYATYDDGSPNTGWIKGITGIMSSAPQSGKIVTSFNTSSPGGDGQQQGEQRSGFSGLMADLGDLLTGGFNKLYGLDEIFGSNTSGGQSDPTGAGIDPNSPKISDDWYTRTLGARISSPYGNRKNPTGSGNQFHKGIDYATAAGTAIKSPIDGTVESNLATSQSGGFGNLLKIKDSAGATHYFAHMQQRSSLQEGARVKSGDVVGKVGSTGNSTGPHLHYQVNTTSDRNSHTEPNGYLAKLFGKLKSNTGQGGGNETKSTPSKKYNGMGGGYDTPKAPKLPNITRRGSIPVKEQPTISETKLLSIIIEVLSKIADNTSSLSDIVQLLSKSLNVEVSEEKINTIKSNNKSIGGSKKQVVNIIKNSLKDSNNPENANLLATLDKLALE